MRRRLTAGLLVAVGLVSSGVAYAGNQPADPSVGADPAAAAPARGGKLGRPALGVLKGAIHGDLLVRAEDGSTRTVTFDRGKITAISEGSITVERADGVAVTKGLTAQTVFNGTPRDQLQPGTAAVVVSAGDTAERVLTKGARADRPAHRKERSEQRKERREERRKGAGGSPSAGPSSFEDDGLETTGP